METHFNGVRIINPHKTQPMTEVEFQKIYTDPELCNRVATAHGQANSKGEHLYKITCTYPRVYIVTDEQIEEAQKQGDKRRGDFKESLKAFKGVLVFVAMGMSYLDDDEAMKELGDIGCHRIRARFVNCAGVEYLIEFSANRHNCVGYATLSHSVNKSTKKDSGRNQSFGYYYTHESIVKGINREYGCNFKSMMVDYNNISTDYVNLCH